MTITPSLVAAVALVASVLLAPAAAQDAAPQRFENTTAGISLARPAGWQTASLQQVQENRERIQLPDAELQAALRKAATAPLFVFTKYAEPHPDVNPSIQVTLRPLGQLAGSPPAEILSAVVGGLQKSFNDFALVSGITETQVSGLAGAHARARYTLRNGDGAEFKVLSRLWLVPRGGFLFLIAMSGPQDGPDVSEADFTATLASISIRH
jgi:hypothetical protein